MRTGSMMLFTLVTIFLPISTLVVAQSCVYNQQMAAGQVYYIYNVEYPNYYSAGTNCKWFAESSTGTQIYLSCEEINIPSSRNCYNDRLLVSLTGNTQFTDAAAYCGNGTLSLLSDGNRLSLALIASYFSTGGRIMCSVTAIPMTSGTPQRPDKCDCGWRHEKKIVGGVETGINEFPYMAALYHRLREIVYCGATIISNRYAISAAHCLDSSSETESLVLLVGDHNPTTGEDTASAAVHLIETYRIHENYNESSKENDIAIIRTTTKIVFSQTVGPVCLPFKYSSYDFGDQYVTLLGWGALELSGPSSDTLQKVDVQVMPLWDCRQNFTTGTIFNSQICTYAPGKDSCQFDSGGPALWEDYNTRRLHQIGIISYGRFCATNVAAINTRVTSYLQWIVKMTSDAQYCIR